MHSVWTKLESSLGCTAKGWRESRQRWEALAGQGGVGFGVKFQQRRNKFFRNWNSNNSRKI
jgi:hypothetical protein